MLVETDYKGCRVTMMGLGMNRTGYHGAFTPTVEAEIERVISPPTLHLFSGRSLLGEERVDLERPEATIRGDVLDFVQGDERAWEWVILDPPYEQKRKKKLADYAKPMSLAADVRLRRAVVAYLQARARNVLWVDYHVASIDGFSRERIWVFVPGGLHPTVNMTWLKCAPAAVGETGQEKP